MASQTITREHAVIDAAIATCDAIADLEIRKLECRASRSWSRPGAPLGHRHLG